MKALKFLALTLFSATILSCGDDDSAPSFQLSEENIVGSYELIDFSGNSDSATTSDGNEVRVSSTISEGDEYFSPVIILSADGTFASSGTYIFDSTTTTLEGEENVRVNALFTDEGTYEFNAASMNIMFTSTSNDLIDGTFAIVRSSENGLTLEQEITQVENSITTTTTSTFVFEK